MNAEEVLGNLKNKKAGSNFSVEKAWRSSMSAYFPGKFLKPFTGKDRGQLKKIGMVAGGHIERLIPFLFENWTRFGNEVQQVTHEQAALLPSIGYTLLHIEVAMNMFLQSIAPVKNSAIPKFVPPSPALPATAAVKDVYKPTAEQIAKDLEEFA